MKKKLLNLITVHLIPIAFYTAAMRVLQTQLTWLQSAIVMLCLVIGTTINVMAIKNREKEKEEKSI